MTGFIYPSRPEIAGEQLRALNALLAEVGESNAFYRQKLSGVVGRDGFETLDQAAARLPFTTKTEWVADQEAHPPYGTNLTYPLARYTRCHQTSGTSGKPMRWLDTPTTWDYVVDDWLTVLSAAGLRVEDRFFFAFSFGPFLGFWGAFEAALKLGAFCLPGGGMSTETRLQAMIQNETTVLACTPTYALRLGQVAEQLGIDRSTLPLRCILVAGEPGGSLPAVRDRLRALWPTAEVFDHHGMTETGPVTFQCPAQSGLLHVIDTSYWAEVIDPKTEKPVADGAQGELVLTTLRRSGSPLIRYRTGDLVQLAEPGSCGCGRYQTTLVGGIIGRSDDMVVVRGVNVYPSAVEEIVSGVEGIAEYRVEVSERQSLMELTVEIEVVEASDDGEATADRLARELQRRLALRIPVRVVAPGSLPRFEMKAKRWVRKTV